MKDKIDKLVAHEESARRLGNIAEANAFQKKIEELKSKEAESERERNKQSRWQCSCGYELVLTDDASAGSLVITDIMLSSHRRPGHQLTLIK